MRGELPRIPLHVVLDRFKERADFGGGCEPHDSRGKGGANGGSRFGQLLPQLPTPPWMRDVAFLHHIQQIVLFNHIKHLGDGPPNQNVNVQVQNFRVLHDARDVKEIQSCFACLMNGRDGVLVNMKQNLVGVVEVAVHNLLLKLGRRINQDVYILVAHDVPK